MSDKWRKISMIAGLLGIFGAIVGGRHDRLVEHQQREQPRDISFSKISALAGVASDASPAAVFDAIRSFVNMHSTHKVDAEFYQLRDRSGFAEASAQFWFMLCQ